MRGRPPLPIGGYGKVTVKGEGKSWTAFCRYRDLDGVTRPVTATGSSRTGADQALKAKLKGRRVTGVEAEITPDSTLEELAEAWFATVDKNQSTRDAYRHALDKHILPPLGRLRLFEASTSRLDAYLNRLDGASVARRCRVVLSLMFNLASRYDAVPANPVADTRISAGASKAVAALSVDNVLAFREHVLAWAGQKANRARVADVVELFVATGLRPGELLAVRFEDVDLRARTLTVSGTVKRDSVNGLHRQAFPKSAAGVRVLTLPDFAVSMLRRRKLAASSGLVFANRNGEPWEPANFRRLWREVRGEEWAHVEPRSFRKAVATLIERESGSIAASLQLGHSSDAVTRKHYIERNTLAPDATGVLGRFAR